MSTESERFEELLNEAMDAHKFVSTADDAIGNAECCETITDCIASMEEAEEALKEALKTVREAIKAAKKGEVKSGD